MRAICACVLLAVSITLAAPHRPVLAQQTIEEMIAEYQRLQQDRKRANEIAKNQKDYSESEVREAIIDRDKLDAFLQGLKNRIKGRGGKIPGKEKLSLHPPPDGTVSGTRDGEVEKKKALKAHVLWELGHWPWNFHPANKFKTLKDYKDEYYLLQKEMSLILHIKRKSWTYKQATDYTGALSTLCALIIDTEEKIAFGLGDAVKFERAIMGHKNEWNKYLAKQKDTDAAKAVMKATEAEWHALLKKSGLKPGDTVPSDDPNARKLNQLAARHADEQKIFLEIQKVSERAKYKSGVINDARKQRIKDGIASTVDNPPKLEIHRGCASNEASLFYEKYLDGDDLLNFRRQSKNRREAIK